MTAISDELLAILVCPETRGPLTRADPALVARLNAAIEAGTLRNRGGDRVERPFDGGLLAPTGKHLYPIVDGIPILLLDEAISIEGPK
jgi:uncharacterized protein YbaR (Trm112 family)